MKLSQLRGWRLTRALGDRLVTSPLARWTWSGLGAEEYFPKLTEFRPADGESVREMLAGRYLLAGKLIDTDGGSPFAVQTENLGWTEELESFSWLRHFRDARDEDGRSLARTLVLDWIGRNGSFGSKNWNLSLLASRVMNWLRHYSLITEGATKAQIVLITRSLSLQIQSAKLRSKLSYEPLDELMGSVILAAATLSDGSDDDAITDVADALCVSLDAHLDRDGFFRSRNPKTQLDILIELVSLRALIMQRAGPAGRRFTAIVEKMHRALDSMALGNGEPGYFNGCGHLATEILVSTQMQGTLRSRSNALTAGYGVIMQGDAVLVMDSGRVPPSAYAKEAHSSALAFEFSSGQQLIVGNCGPAPDELQEHRDAFRQAVAHSGPSINGEGASKIDSSGHLHSYGDKPFIEVSKTEPTIVARTSGFQSRFGVQIERSANFISNGQSLVGQDKIITSKSRLEGQVSISFHLAPGVKVERSPDAEMISLRLPSGDVWVFLWEGAQLRVDESVRHSRNIGFHRTEQIILSTALVPDAEIAWIFTRQGI